MSALPRHTHLCHIHRRRSPDLRHCLLHLARCHECRLPDFLGPRALGLVLTCTLTFPPISLLPVRAGPVFSPRLSEQASPFLLPVRSSPASASACHPFLFHYSPYITSSDLISIFPLHFPFFSLRARPSSCSYATAPVHL